MFTDLNCGTDVDEVLAVLRGYLVIHDDSRSDVSKGHDRWPMRNQGLAEAECCGQDARV